MKDLYTLPEPHGSHVSHVLDVGIGKAMGFVLPADIAKAGYTPATLKEKITQQGLKVLELGAVPSYVHVIYDDGKPVRLNERAEFGVQGALFYAYDEAELRRLLSAPRNAAILAEAHWPSEPEAFVKRVHEETAYPKTALYDLISNAFGSYKNARRSDRISTSYPEDEVLRGLTPQPISSVPIRALDPRHGAKEYRAVLEETGSLCDGSRQHYIAQAEAVRGVYVKDWLAQIQDGQAAKPTVSRR